MTESRAFVWRTPLARIALGIVPAWCTAAVLVFGAPRPMKLVVGAMLAIAILSPYRGLLAVAALAPLADYTGALLNLGSYRLGEAATVAFLTGWLLRGDDGREGPRVHAWAAWAAAAAIVVSMAATATAASAWRPAIEWMFYGYYLSSSPIGWSEGARLLEGIALAVAVVAVVRARPNASVTLPAALTAAAVLAAATSVLLWFGIAPEPVLRRHALLGYRVAAHVADVNAAGSYFALSLCVATGMAVRAAGRQRAYWLAGALACATATWLAASRTASGAAGGAALVAAGWWLAADWSHKAKMTIAAAAAAAVLAAGAYQARTLARDPDYRSADFRLAFNASSMRMIAAAPWSGVGVGRYMYVSPLFLGPSVAFSYGAENAHNYFLQLASELGLIGFAAFLVWLAVGFVKGLRAIAATPRDARLLGLLAGAAVFLVTWTTGHPLLVFDAAVPFWIVFGLLIALADSTLLAVSIRSARNAAATLVAAALIVAVAAGNASGGGAALRPRDSRDVTGLYDWETDADGRRYRWTEQFASIFVPADVTRVYVPVRVPEVSREISPMGVEARTEGRPGTRIMVGGGWATINLELPDAAPYAGYKRINLRADRIWQPAVYQAGSNDMRGVGVQLGELILFRER